MRFPIFSLALLGQMFVASNAYGIVDMKSANYSESWTDIATGLLTVKRTYNSRTLHDGLVGYGWCTDFETKLEVILPGAIRITECGAGMENLYYAKGYDVQSAIADQINSILVQVQKRRGELTSGYLTSLKAELQKNDFMFDEFNERLGFRFEPSAQTTFYAVDGESTVVFQNQQFVRRSAGEIETFDLLGRLVSKRILGEGAIRLRYERDRLVKVLDNNGNSISFNYNRQNGKLQSATDSLGESSEYAYSGQDLISSKDAGGGTYKYSYDDKHDLIRIDYPDGSYKALTYNKEKDWVTSFRNRKGCVESYTYNIDVDDPKNHFGATVRKTCNERVTNSSSYEFIHKPNKGGLGSYLATVIVINNGARTRIDYNGAGLPIYIENKGSITRDLRDPSGRIVQQEKNGAVYTFVYHSTCRLPTRAIETKGGVSAWTFVRYDQACNLVFVERNGIGIDLGYDGLGRIVKMTDNRKRQLKISYDGNSKPSMVDMLGVGSINIKYSDNGQIESVKSPAGHQVAMEIAAVFNELLDLSAAIKP